MQTPGPDLRERRRLDTLKAVHDAAVALVRESDLTSVTIDAMAARAGISRRTFFNYYATKEDAVLGTTAPVIPRAALEEFVDPHSGVDQFTRALSLIIATVQSTRGFDRTQMSELRELIGRFPELRARLKQHTAAAEALVEGVLIDHFSQEGTDLTKAGDSARALLLLASAVLRFAYSRDPGVLTDAKGAAVTEAIEVFREALDGTVLCR
ncbi:MAG: TetR/AcrR family transcriptional regulator [Actinomycetales bacterium]